VLPCLVIITIIYYFYDAFKSNFWVKSALMGMGGVISAVLFITVYDMAKVALKKNTVFSAILMTGAFAASFFFKIQVIIIIVSLALIGFITFSLLKESEVR